MTEISDATKASEPKAKAARTGPGPKANVKPAVALSKKATKLKSTPTAKSVSTAESIKNAELAARAIEKFTGQKPIGLNEHPLPYVSTGSTNIDYIIGGVLASDKTGPLCPGYPRGHITEIYGAEASGKTTLTLESIVEVQRAGGSAMFLDFEHALSHKYAKDLGINFDPRRLMLYQPENMEQGLDMLRLGILTGVDLIVVDSVAAMVPKAEMEKNFEDPNKIGFVALKLAQALPKIVRFLRPNEKNPLGTAVIFINQTRASINTGYGGAAGDTTSGGKALKYYAFLRLQLTCLRSERIVYKDPVSKKEKKAPFGSHTQVKVVKSKIDAKQGQTADIFIRFGQGIDDLYTIIEAGVAHRLIKKNGAFFEYDGQRYQGRERLRAFLLNDKTALEKLQRTVLGMIRSQAEVDPEAAAEMEAGDGDFEVDALLANSLESEEETSDSDVPEEVDIESEVEE